MTGVQTCALPISVLYGNPISAEHIKALGDEAFAEELTRTLRTMQADLRQKRGRPPFDYSTTESDN